MPHQGMKQPGQGGGPGGRQGERDRLLGRDQQAPGAGISLVDHPDYEAPRLTKTWGQMLPRMCCGCVFLLIILGAMGGVVWSIVSDAPGDPLHQKKPIPMGGYTPLPSAKVGGRKAAAGDSGTSIFKWFKGILNSRPAGNDNR